MNLNTFYNKKMCNNPLPRQLNLVKILKMNFQINHRNYSYLDRFSLNTNKIHGENYQHKVNT
jgi:hypothetical protein